MVQGVGPSFPDIEAALATVQKTLDRLTAAGHDEAAFDLARAQFSASMRSSWPGNLSTLVGSLEAVAANATLKLTEEQRAELRTAIETLRQVQHP
jgi:ferric-dicitrate binding protein FerR (iron transport regulator)